MSAEQLWHWADLQRFIRSVGPFPPHMATGALPQRTARPLTVVLPHTEHESAELHGLAALRAGWGVGHAAHLNGARGRQALSLGITALSGLGHALTSGNGCQGEPGAHTLVPADDRGLPTCRARIGHGR